MVPREGTQGAQGCSYLPSSTEVFQSFTLRCGCTWMSTGALTMCQMLWQARPSRSMASFNPHNHPVRCHHHHRHHHHYSKWHGMWWSSLLTSVLPVLLGEFHRSLLSWCWTICSLINTFNYLCLSPVQRPGQTHVSWGFPLLMDTFQETSHRPLQTSSNHPSPSLAELATLYSVPHYTWL